PQTPPPPLQRPSSLSNPSPGAFVWAEAGAVRFFLFRKKESGTVQLEKLKRATASKPDRPPQRGVELALKDMKRRGHVPAFSYGVEKTSSNSITKPLQ
uniref:hypothetical protein n=1 Tax=uncultured Bilophila sp. TaxID=529385 RepID=UPI0025EAB6DC